MSNFSFLAEHSPLLAELGATAEKLYPFDPASYVFKLRLLSEDMTHKVASSVGARMRPPTQAEPLRAVNQHIGLPHGFVTSTDRSQAHRSIDDQRLKSYPTGKKRIMNPPTAMLATGLLNG